MGGDPTPGGLRGLDIGTQLVGPILVGFGIGWWLDRRYALDPPWCTMALVLLGSVAGFRAVFTLARRMERADPPDLGIGVDPTPRERDDGER